MRAKLLRAVGKVSNASRLERELELEDRVDAGGHLAMLCAAIEDQVGRIVTAQLGSDDEVPTDLVIHERHDGDAGGDRIHLRREPSSAATVVEVFAADVDRPHALVIHAIAADEHPAEPERI